MTLSASPAVDPADHVEPWHRALAKTVAKKHLRKSWSTLAKHEKMIILALLLDGAQPILAAEAVLAVRAIASIATDMTKELFEMTPEELAEVQRMMRSGTPQHEAIEAVRLSRP